MDARRQPAYLLDRELPLQESEIRNAIYTNSLILQGVKQVVHEAHHRRHPADRPFHVRRDRDACV